MKQLDGRSKKARALKAAAEAGIKAEAARQEAIVRDLLDTCAPEGGIGLRGRYVPMEFNEAPSARTGQVGGDHYKNLGIEPWDVEQAWLTDEQFKGFLLASAISYIARYNVVAEGKGGLPDIKKAHHYLEKLIEVSGG